MSRLDLRMMLLTNNISKVSWRQRVGLQGNIEIVHTSSSREIQLQTKKCAVVDY